MLNSIISTFRNAFAKPLVDEDFDFDAEYEACIREEQALYEQEQAEIRAEWSAMSSDERADWMERMDEMSVAGNADDCRYYRQWVARRCR